MATRQYTSGNLQRKSDFCVTYIPSKSGKIITTIHSKTAVLHGSKLHDICSTTLSDLHISYGRLEVTDTGGQYFVLKARIEAVVKAANPKTVAESLPEFKKHAHYKSRADRFRRSRLYLPGNQGKLMLNAGIHKPDAIILDLEDSVAPSEKNTARLIVRNALRTLDFFGSERMVRINQGKTGLKDLEAVIPHNVHLILVPKVETAKQLI
jgi:citrate lyase subunit beta/citryl-CoA lyase